MIKIKNLVVKNFMSVGNASQAVNFDRSDLTLVLGENLDLGGDGERNGVGKTTLLNALSYGLYGTAISNIKLNNLVNKSNSKNMLVSIEFSVDDIEYRIERGRKPNLLKFYVDGEDQDNDDAQGENRETQKTIERTLKTLSHDMFTHSVALNTYTEPFLSMRVADQRNIIEQLLGITVLSEKSDKLKLVNKRTKDDIKEEEFRLAAIIKANEHIEEQISNLERRQRVWINSKEKNTEKLIVSIEELMKVDIQEEIEYHKENDFEIIRVDKENATAKAEADEANSKIKIQTTKDKATFDKWETAVKECNRWISQIEKDNLSQDRRAQSLQKDIELLEDHKCHACGQDLHDTQQEENITSKKSEMSKCTMQLLSNQTQEQEHKLKLAELGAPPVFEQYELTEAKLSEPKVVKTFYKTVEKAHEHKSSLETLTMQLETAIEEQDPYIDQIKDMQDKGLQEVDYDVMNNLAELRDHQAFLLKLLTSKDSFIRKKIIEQNLNYLNGRLTHYLQEIGLPHTIQFLSDLSVEISEMGRDLDFDNLSRGERTRLIMSLSLAFRDVWESLYSHINLLFVDELVDNGLDTAGVEASIKLLKGMARDRGKSVWVVSHREELVNRVSNTMKVIKTGGYTEYSSLVE